MPSRSSNLQAKAESIRGWAGHESPTPRMKETDAVFSRRLDHKWRSNLCIIVFRENVPRKSLVSAPRPATFFCIMLQRDNIIYQIWRSKNPKKYYLLKEGVILCYDLDFRSTKYIELSDYDNTTKQQETNIFIFVMIFKFKPNRCIYFFLMK